MFVLIYASYLPTGKWATKTAKFFEPKNLVKFLKDGNGVTTVVNIKEVK